MKIVSDTNLSTERKNEMIAELKAMLLPKVKPVVDAVKTKYRLQGRRFNKRDFFRICQREHIELANGAVFKFMASCEQILGCCMTMPDSTKSIYLRCFFEGDHFDTATAAHELGHYFMQHRGGNPSELFLKRSEQTDPVGRDIRELEADLFADLILQVHPV